MQDLKSWANLKIKLAIKIGTAFQSDLRKIKTRFPKVNKN